MAYQIGDVSAFAVVHSKSLKREVADPMRVRCTEERLNSALHKGAAENSGEVVLVPELIRHFPQGEPLECLVAMQYFVLIVVVMELSTSL